MYGDGELSDFDSNSARIQVHWNSEPIKMGKPVIDSLMKLSTRLYLDGPAGELNCDYTCKKLAKKFEEKWSNKRKDDAVDVPVCISTLQTSRWDLIIAPWNVSNSNNKPFRYLIVIMA